MKERMPYREHAIGRSKIICADSIKWLEEREPESIHAIVTDPPYGLKEYELEEIARKDQGTNGKGIWRIPPSFDGCVRAPVPRFTDLKPHEIEKLVQFFTKWAELCNKVLVPGGHMFVATNTFMSQVVYSAITAGGPQFRGQFIRLVQTLRGGDKPKNAEEEFPNVCSLPKGKHEPWGIWRKPIPKGMTVAECLRTYGTGGLRNLGPEQPFPDVLPWGRTTKEEKELADHPTQKPLGLMRFLVRASLPLGKGVVLDPFSGAGTTVAAAELEGYQALGIEWNPDYFEMSSKAIPALIQLDPQVELELQTT